jgi:hypothetical protein
MQHLVDFSLHRDSTGTTIDIFPRVNTRESPMFGL